MENIKKRHTAECIWRENPCDESFELLPTDSNVLKQELIENMTSWTGTDKDGFYVIPKLDPKSKQVLMKCIEPMHTVFSKQKGSASWTEYSHCCTLMLLSGSGWHLTTNQSLHFVQCQYCNKCVSLQSYESKKMMNILPENIHNVSYSTTNNSFLRAINEDDEVEVDDDGKEMELDSIGFNIGNLRRNRTDKMEADGDEEESDGPELDISSILSRELPLNDTDSVMHRLSKLGLRINNTVRRSLSCQIYETRTLQKQAHFSSAESVCSSGGGSPSSSTMTMSPSPPPIFGLTPIRSTFGGGHRASFGMASMGTSALNWPKMSVFNSTATSIVNSNGNSNTNSNVNSNVNSNTNSMTNSAVKSIGKKKKKKKKRKRSRMEMEQLDQVKEEETEIDALTNSASKDPKGAWSWPTDETPSRKKMKIESKHDTKSGTKSDVESNIKSDTKSDGKLQQKEDSKPQSQSNRKRKRRSRKRKSTELESDLFMNPIAEETAVPTKRRKIGNDSNSNSSSTSSVSSSVSTTLSISPSKSNSLDISSKSITGTPVRNKRKSRKRAFNEVFKDSIDEGGDGDSVQEQKDTVPSLVKPARKKKRARLERLDTPNVGAQMYFDPIKMHNAHCPFVKQFQYQKEKVAGYVYALRLMPKDVMYIKQIVEQQKEKENP